MTNTLEKPRFNFRLYGLAVQMVTVMAPIATASDGATATSPIRWSAR